MRMRGKVLVAVVLAALVVTLVAIAAPGAFAGQVTKIQYPQLSADTYSFTCPNTSGTQDFTATLSWTDMAGNPIDGWPTSEIDLLLQGPDTAAAADQTGPYEDLTDESFYPGDNPFTTNAVTLLRHGGTYYITVQPWLADTKYTLDCYISRNGGTPAEITGFPKTGNAYGGGGDVYVPSMGTWHSCVQWWPGTGTSYTQAWNDYAYGRNTDDIFAEGIETTFLPPQPAVTTPVDGVTHDPGTDNEYTDGSTEWAVVCPQIWGTAATPNSWPSGASYPKPGSLAWTASSAWYTYSFTDDSKADAPAYFFTQSSVATASQRSFSSDASSASSLSYRFYGPSVKWVYPTYKYGGFAKVTVDGVAQPLVNQYSLALTQGASTTFSGFDAASYHTIVITSNKTKDPASLGFFTYHDAFVAPQDPDDTTPTAENNLDGSTTYQWGRSVLAGPSGGSFSSTKASGAALAFTWKGTSITWKYVTYKYGGIQKVFIDGVQQANVDQYSAAMTLTGPTTQKTYSGLTDDWHTIFITGNGSKNASSLGLFIYHDAFLPNGGTPVED
jgi:hypothetical protein